MLHADMQSCVIYRGGTLNCSRFWVYALELTLSPTPAVNGYLVKSGDSKGGIMISNEITGLRSTALAIYAINRYRCTSRNAAAA